MVPERDRQLRARLELARFWNPANNYYAITLTGTVDGRVGWSVHSHYAGPSDQYRAWEKRAASIVRPREMVALWRSVGQSWLVVDDRKALALWIRLGGNALVETGLAMAHLARVVTTKECAPEGPIGFRMASSLAPQERARRPSRSVRAHVFERDGHACLRCGRGEPEVKLSRHHVLAREDGGLTRADNLATLCEECHRKLHGEGAWPPAPDLQGAMLGATLNAGRLTEDDHDAAVARHRARIAALTTA